VAKDLRLGAIVAIVNRVRNKTGQLGKIQLQKLIYFLQQTGVPLGYRFEIYHYGPYSFELSDQISSLDSLGVLSVVADPSGYGFDIRVGPHGNKYEVDTRYDAKINEVIERFGSDTPANLEVKSTLHFVNKVLKKHSGGNPSETLVVSKVKELKPRFSDEFVTKRYKDLKKLKML
jgi:uncharacterized protein YwgA